MPAKVALSVTLIGCLLLVAAVIVAYGGIGGPKAREFATLSAQRASVAYQRGDDAPTTMRIDETFELGEGDGVDVDIGGEGALQFADFLRVRIFRDTELRIEGMVAEDAPPIYRLRLSGGSVFSTITPDEIAGQRVKLHLETESAVIEDTGTEFFAYVDPVSEVTWVVVKDGSVTVTAVDMVVTVDAGFQSWVEPGQPPASPVPATRQQIGDRFPLIDDLTGDAIQDDALLARTTTTPEIQPPTATISQADENETPFVVPTTQPTETTPSLPEGEPTATDTPATSTAGGEIYAGAVVAVANTGGTGTNMRASPSVDSEIVTVVPDGTELVTTGDAVEADGFLWWPVEGEVGSGYIVADYLVLIE